MKEQHPVDDLFARALREAEVTPPPEVWQAIASQQGSGGNRLAQRWGWLPLVLLLGGAGSVLLTVHSKPDQAGRTNAPETLPTWRSAHPERLAPQMGMREPVGAGPGNHEALPAIYTMRKAGPSQKLGLQANQSARQAGLAGKQTSSSTSSMAGHGTTSPHPESNPPHTLVEQDLPAAGALTHGHYSPPTKAWHTPSAILSGGVHPTPTTTVRAEDSRPEHLALRQFNTAPIIPLQVQAAPPVTYRRVSNAWWVAANAGLGTEHRTWRGGEPGLIKALQSTEVPHPAASMGFLFGRESRGGWSVATGLEQSVSRFNFRHVDRYSTRQDSLVTYLITFNSQVLTSYTDTVSVFNNVLNPVEAVNRVTTLRIPMEVGWRTAYGRFLFGARSGISLEMSTIRSGATLTSTAEGIRSENAIKAQDRTTFLVGGTVAADLGYALHERWGVWASPSFTTGLFPLYQAEQQPYAVSHRLGIRFRLSYTLKPAH